MNRRSGKINSSTGEWEPGTLQKDLKLSLIKLNKDYDSYEFYDYLPTPCFESKEYTGSDIECALLRLCYRFKRIGSKIKY